MLSIRACGLTLGIFGAASMFFLAWWLILTGNAEGPVTLFERIYRLQFHTNGKCYRSCMGLCRLGNCLSNFCLVVQ